jgi:hypothetical protein
MSDWQVGDLALCVNNDTIRYSIGGGPRPDLVIGKAYRVRGIEIDHLFDGELCLLIAGAVRSASHARFRKIRPDAHERCEQEFTTLLKRITRKEPVTSKIHPRERAGSNVRPGY